MTVGERAPYDKPEHPVRDWQGPLHEVWRRETSRYFHDLMDSAMLVSYNKYGEVAAGYPDRVSAIKSLKLRLKKYEQTGNAEYLVDVANFAMIEFMYPARPNAHLKHTDADGSPGRVAANDAIYDKPTQFKNTDLEAAGVGRKL